MAVGEAASLTVLRCMQQGRPWIRERRTPRATFAVRPPGFLWLRGRGEEGGRTASTELMRAVPPPVNCLPPTLGRSGLVHLAPLETDIDRCETHVLAHRGAPGKPQPGTFG